MSQKQDNSKVIPCHCGTTPNLVSKITAITKSELFFYKCPNCGQEGEMLWTKTSLNIIPSWNHTIRSIVARKKT